LRNWARSGASKSLGAPYPRINQVRLGAITKVTAEAEAQAKISATVTEVSQKTLFLVRLTFLLDTLESAASVFKAGAAGNSFEPLPRISRKSWK
jgi:hypothetical protein